MNRLVLLALYPVRYYAYATALPAGREALIHGLPEEPETRELPASG